MNADRSSGERIRRLKALAAANGPAAKSRDYDTWQAVQFGKTPYLRLSATGAVVEENCCSGSGSDPDQYCAWNPANVRNFYPAFGGVAYGNDRWVAVGVGSDAQLPSLGSIKIGLIPSYFILVNVIVPPGGDPVS